MPERRPSSTNRLLKWSVIVFSLVEAALFIPLIAKLLH